MCDTMVALGNSTKDGSVIFAKNSDRQPNEPLLTIKVPRKKHGSGKRLRCTYLEIDQAEETYEALLLKPSWMWGAEMGANEFGLNIGNEAVFTRERNGPDSLIGMDLLRLALERCQTAKEALNLIVLLLEQYGQGGNCGFEKPFHYHNSFLIADPESAWVLETAGPYWAAQEVKEIKVISNRLSISKDYDLAHPDLVKNAVDKGWCKNEADFDFARCYSRKLHTFFSGSRQRSSISSCRLESEKGQVTLETVKGILRTHEKKLEGKQFRKASLKSVCMHAGNMIGDHTTGSYAARLKKNSHTYLLTGSSTPCLALYKPFWIIDGENFSFNPGQQEESIEFWLKRELLHRAILENKLPGYHAYLARRDKIELEIKDLLNRIMPELDQAAGIPFSKNHSSGLDLLDKQKLEIMQYAFKAEEELLNDTLSDIVDPYQPGRIEGNPIFRWYWKSQNQKLTSKIGKSIFQEEL